MNINSNKPLAWWSSPEFPAIFCRFQQQHLSHQFYKVSELFVRSSSTGMPNEKEGSWVLSLVFFRLDWYCENKPLHVRCVREHTENGHKLTLQQCEINAKKKKITPSIGHQFTLETTESTLLAPLESSP